MSWVQTELQFAVKLATTPPHDSSVPSSVEERNAQIHLDPCLLQQATAIDSIGNNWMFVRSFVRMSYPVWMGATPLTPLQNLCIEVEREEEERAPSSVISLLIDSIGK